MIAIDDLSSVVSQRRSSIKRDDPSAGHLLIQRHLDGDPHAFTELVRCYERRVFGFALRSGVEASAAEDLVQDVFLKVHRAAERYRPEKALEAWLFTIVGNTIRDHFRRQKTKRNFMSRWLNNKKTESRENGMNEQLEHRDTARFIQEEIQNLPQNQAQALLLSTTEHLDYTQVADVMGIPENTVKTLVRRARLSLAKSMERREKTQNREALGKEVNS